MLDLLPHVHQHHALGVNQAETWTHSEGRKQSRQGPNKIQGSLSYPGGYVLGSLFNHMLRPYNCAVVRDFIFSVLSGAKTHPVEIAIQPVRTETHRAQCKAAFNDYSPCKIKYFKQKQKHCREQRHRRR